MGDAEKLPPPLDDVFVEGQGLVVALGYIEADGKIALRKHRLGRFRPRELAKQIEAAPEERFGILHVSLLHQTEAEIAAADRNLFACLPKQLPIDGKRPHKGIIGVVVAGQGGENQTELIERLRHRKALLGKTAFGEPDGLLSSPLGPSIIASLPELLRSRIGVVPDPSWINLRDRRRRPPTRHPHNPDQHHSTDAQRQKGLPIGPPGGCVRCWSVGWWWINGCHCNPCLPKSFIRVHRRNPILKSWSLSAAQAQTTAHARP